jgi:predicted transcriptional regulator of viral defense system
LLGVSLVAARAALRRLAEKKAIASPQRGFHVILPPEYRRVGCLPPKQFVPQLMATRGLTYYVGLLPAAQYHGSAHHRPQQFQVMVERPRPAISCGEVRVAFIARRAAASVAVELRNTPRGTIRVSTPEATALDLVGYPAHAGGLDAVATVLSELVDRLDPMKLRAMRSRRERDVLTSALADHVSERRLPGERKPSATCVASSEVDSQA